ncbi:hypothetical protein OHV05_36015 (plasmid) [Kitasatospora sp. NBC_00070]|uniref:hypothetical protein n=1 Tax=Kitasatospora sp. NBC_00070 TaxID=2975962 RepID=UPI002F919608
MTESVREKEPSGQIPEFVQLAAERAARYLSLSVGDGGAPSAELTLDPGFGTSFSGNDARAVLRERFGIDPGFELSGEAFSAMVTLMLQPPPEDRAGRRRVARLVSQIETARWKNRYRFFPHANGFPADTDCTGMAAGALYGRGLLSAASLDACVRDLLQATAPTTALPGQARPSDDTILVPAVPLVYWEDDTEPGTGRRGRKHDAVACANALHTVQLSNSVAAQAAEFTGASHRYLADHLASGRYLDGTRYYPSPDAFLYALSRLCARFPTSARVLSNPLHQAFSEREATASAEALASRTSSALDIALRTLTADNLSRTDGQAERRLLLAQAQRGDGSWPACSYYRMGRFPVYFGSSYLTTVFALQALRTREHPVVGRARAAFPPR